MEAAYVFVLLGVILLYFQLIFGRICRWSKSWLVQIGAGAPHYLSSLFASIALANMPQERTVPVWIMYATVLSNSMVAYDAENRFKYLWTSGNILYFVYRATGAVDRADDLGASSRLAAKTLVAAMVFACASCKVSITMASSSKRRSMEVDEYMRRHENVGQDYDPSTLQGYRYVVDWETRTTVEHIFMHSHVDVEGNPSGGRWDEELGRRQKDLCLSFALFRLLFRRQHGLLCAEADLPKTRALVLEGLLPDEEQAEMGEYRRGFGVVEVELGFLHDHIHGGYVLWSRTHRASYYVLAGLKALLMYAGPALYIAVAASHPDSVSITLLVLHGLLDLLQVIFYCSSDRWMVSYMCRAHPQKDGLRRMVAHLRRSIKLPEFIRSNDYWQSRIGQYSLLEETRRRPRSMAADAATLLFRPRSWFGHKAQESESSPARLPPGLKASIVRVLRESNGELDGVPSLERAHNLPYWELRGHRSSHKIKVVLKWHIATCYCDIALRRSLEQPVGTSSRGVAEALSMYCGYLVAFRPALLPGRQSYTKAAFQQVLDEVMALVGDQLSVQGRFESLERRREQGHMETLEQTVTLSDGLDLGYLLISRVRDRELLWRVLENIWVKLILSLAPQQSDDAAYAKHHATYLARGGEFVTHLWAMLSHAGILEQSTWPRDGQVHEEPQEFYNQLMARYANVHYSP